MPRSSLDAETRAVSAPALSERTLMSTVSPIDSHSLWDVEKLAQFIAVTPGALRCMLRRGEVPRNCICRVGVRRIRFLPAAVLEWLKLEPHGQVTQGNAAVASGR